MKKIFGLVAVLIITLGFSVITAEAQTFKDVDPSKEYYEAVENLVQLGSISKAEKYNPSKEVTRGQMAKIMAITLGLDTKNVKNPKFKDVPTKHEFYPYVAALVEAGIVNGYKDNTFGVNNKMTRGQMAKILVNGFELPETTTYDSYFNDEVKGSEVFNYAYTLQYYEVATSASFKPNDKVKRSQMALFINRAIDAKMVAQLQVRVPWAEFGVSEDELDTHFINNPHAVAIEINLAKNEFIVSPLAEGISAFHKENDTEYVMIDVDKDLNLTYRVANELEYYYKTLYQYEESTNDNNYASIAFKSLNSEEIDEDSYIFEEDEDNTNYYFYSPIPGALYELTITYVDGSKELRHFYIVETKETVTTKLVSIGSETSVVYDGEENGEYKLVSGDKSAVKITTQDDKVWSIEFTKPGNYTFTRYGDMYYEAEVFEVDGKLIVNMELVD